MHRVDKVIPIVSVEIDTLKTAIQMAYTASPLNNWLACPVGQLNIPRYFIWGVRRELTASGKHREEKCSRKQQRLPDIVAITCIPAKR
jgi:hypothetical protein